MSMGFTQILFVVSQKYVGNGFSGGKLPNKLTLLVDVYVYTYMNIYIYKYTGYLSPQKINPPNKNGRIKQ